MSRRDLSGVCCKCGRQRTLLAGRVRSILRFEPCWKAANAARAKNQVPTSSPSLRTIYNRRYNAKHPLKRSAHKAVENALKRGELVKAVCEVCGDIEAEAHHDDYSNPLKVMWLCGKHHIRRHAELRRLGVSTLPEYAAPSSRLPASLADVAP